MKTIWRIAGEGVGSCNCAWGCPCQFNALPTHGRCEALVAHQVRSGHYGSVDLSGIRMAQFMSFPGAVHEGNGTRQFVFDDRTTTEQLAALREMASGKAGGPVFEIFAAVCPNELPPLRARIELEIDRERRRAAIRIPGIAESIIEPIKNPVTGEEHRARIHLPFGFEYKEAEMGNSVHWKVTAGVTMEYANTYAQLNEFDWTNLQSTESSTT